MREQFLLKRAVAKGTLNRLAHNAFNYMKNGQTASYAVLIATSRSFSKWPNRIFFNSKKYI